MKCDKGPIKVLQVTGKMNRGGAETLIMTLYRAIEREKVQFDFLCFGNSEGDFDKEIINLGGNIITISSPREDGLYQFLKDLYSVFKKERYDVVHSHILFNSAWPLLIGKLFKVKVRIAHAHSTKSSAEINNFIKLKHKIMKYILLFSVTNKIACSYNSGIFLFGDKFKDDGLVLNNCIDTRGFQAVDYKQIELIKKKFEIKKETINVIQVGTLKDVKNHEYSIKIARALKDSNIDFKMYFVGDGELKSKLVDMQIKLNLQKDIMFVGKSSNVKNIMELADVVILPSKYEGLPVTIIEAQALGKPCLVSSKVTKEVEMGLDLVEFIDIDEQSVEKWKNSIIKVKNKKNVSKEEAYIKINENGYDVKSSLKIINNIYRGR